MESYEYFPCRCERGDILLRKSHKPHSFGRLCYACPRSNPSKQDLGCRYFKWKDKITFGNASSFSKPSTPSISSLRASSSSGLFGAALSPGNAECSNCKILTMKIKILEARLAMESVNAFIAAAVTRHRLSLLLSPSPEEELARKEEIEGVEGFEKELAFPKVTESGPTWWSRWEIKTVFRVREADDDDG
nr:hypothetical protein [Tanacetum cinerariifolium]